MKGTLLELLESLMIIVRFVFIIVMLILGAGVITSVVAKAICIFCGVNIMGTTQALVIYFTVLFMGFVAYLCSITY